MEVSVEFILVSDDKLRISLDRQDMDEYGIAFEKLSSADEKTRRALLQLLQIARDEAGFSPRGAKLFIEAYQDAGGGCSLYFTIIRKPSRLSGSLSVVAPVVFEFDDAESLITAACKTFKLYSHRIYKSSLYLMNGKYRLLVYNLDYSDKLSVYFLSEYAAPRFDEITAAYTAEHGRELIADCALETLSGYFGQGFDNSS